MKVINNRKCIYVMYVLKLLISKFNTLYLHIEKTVPTKKTKSYTFNYSYIANKDVIHPKIIKRSIFIRKLEQYTSKTRIVPTITYWASIKQTSNLWHQSRRTSRKCRPTNKIAGRVINSPCRRKKGGGPTYTVARCGLVQINFSYHRTKFSIFILEIGCIYNNSFFFNIKIYLLYLNIFLYVVLIKITSYLYLL